MKYTIRMSTKLIVPFLMVLSIGACYSDYGLSVSDFDVVLTQYDKDFNFDDTTKTTYVLDDTVRYLGEDDPERTHDNQLKSRTIEELNGLGFVKVDLDTLNLPDFYVSIAVTSSDVYSYWGYPGWGWGWGWGYPSYWGGYVSYSYSTGTVITTMGDVEKLDVSDPDKPLMPTIWSSTFNGITNDAAANVVSRIDRAIDQAFSQSEYLKR